MNAFPSMQEKTESLQRLSAAAMQPVAAGAEPDLEITRQAAALRAQALWQFVATFRAAFRQGWDAATAAHPVASS